MRHRYLVFDLDGTISDPGPGFVRSINYALANNGFETRPEPELRAHIGPPLEQSLAELTASDDAALIASLVADYRERYGDVGYRENVIYDGISEAIDQLHAFGHVALGVCSSKRVDFVEQILDLYDLRHRFDFVSGGEVGMEKSQQLASLLEQGAIDTSAVMIGDRKFDIVAAHTNGLTAAGVLWGYGSREELEAARPRHLLARVDELTRFGAAAA